EMNFRNIRHSADVSHMRVDTPEVVAGFEELREDIESGIAKGVFPPIAADFLMAAIVGVAFEINERILRRDVRDAKAAADFATALLLGGIRALPHASNDAAKTDAA